MCQVMEPSSTWLPGKAPWKSCLAEPWKEWKLRSPQPPQQEQSFGGDKSLTEHVVGGTMGWVVNPTPSAPQPLQLGAKYLTQGLFKVTNLVKYPILNIFL